MSRRQVTPLSGDEMYYRRGSKPRASAKEGSAGNPLSSRSGPGQRRGCICILQYVESSLQNMHTTAAVDIAVTVWILGMKFVSGYFVEHPVACPRIPKPALRGHHAARGYCQYVSPWHPRQRRPGRARCVSGTRPSGDDIRSCSVQAALASVSCIGLSTS